MPTGTRLSGSAMTTKSFEMDLIAQWTELADWVGLSPFQLIIVSSMLLSGAVVQWTFKHAPHSHGDHDHHE